MSATALTVESNRWDEQIFYVLETVTEVANKWMIQMFQHPPFPDDVAHTLGPYHYLLD